MATFQDDIDTDLTNVFLDTTGYGMATAATYTTTAGASTSIKVVFVEYIGAIDPYSRSTMTVRQAALSADPQRGDYVVLNGETARWYVVDVRDDRNGGFEIRCDQVLERQ